MGSGESGSDICNEISKFASATALAIRGKHGHLIPRKQADGRVTDLNTNRCRYSNPYVLGDWVGYVNQLVRVFHWCIELKSSAERFRKMHTSLHARIVEIFLQTVNAFWTRMPDDVA